jgi:site-specific DNA-methyltransferase (adenine-specific)
MVMVAHRRGGRLKWEATSKGPETANVVRLPKIIPSADDHPTPKPVELVAHFLRLHAKPGDVVLDPFMGHAPAGVACIRAGLGYIGIEIDPGYFQIAVDRCRRELDVKRGHGPTLPLLSEVGT